MGEVHALAAQPGDRLQVKILEGEYCDTIVGIKAENIKRIFLSNATEPVSMDEEFGGLTSLDDEDILEPNANQPQRQWWQRRRWW